MTAPDTPSASSTDGGASLSAGNEQRVLDALVASGLRRGWWTESPALTRAYVRLSPTREPYGVLSFESPGGAETCVTLLFTDRPSEDADGEPAPLDGLGWMASWRFPDDPGLLTLRAVVEQTPMRVVRYRPLQRCTLATTGAAPRAFVKVFPDDRGARLHAECVALWQARQQGALHFDVAPPLQWDPARRALWQGVVPGTPLVDRLAGREGPALAAALGRACASLPGSGLQPTEAFDGDVQMARTRRYAVDIAAALPGRAEALDLLLARLAAVHADAGPARRRPIHGAPHPQQWLAEGDALGLIDFDRFSLGDPELDVATFVGEMDFETGTAVPVAAINAAFVEGYASVWPALDRRLLDAYLAHKHVAKVVRTVRSARPDRLPKADRLLGALLAAYQSVGR